MDGYLTVGTLAAILIIVGCFVRPLSKPQEWRLPKIDHVGPMIWVLGGCNAITEAVKVGRWLAFGDFALKDGATFEDLSTDVALFFLGGLLAVLVVGLISIKDGVDRLAP